MPRFEPVVCYPHPTPTPTHPHDTHMPALAHPLAMIVGMMIDNAVMQGEWLVAWRAQMRVLVGIMASR